jgi:hypothetical protein
MRYPRSVLEGLAQTELLRFYAVELNGSTEASAAALVAEKHWMYWLAAQSEIGRAGELGYMALAALLDAAHAAGATAVNLGASAGLPGVAQFKKRFGSVDVPVLEHRSTTVTFRVAATIVRARNLARSGHAGASLDA